MGSHPTWFLVVAAFSILVTGSKVPRQIVYQIRPAPLSAFASPDGTFLLDDGVTEFSFPSFGLKNPESKLKSGPIVAATSVNNESSDAESSSASSSSSISDETSSAATREEYTNIPQYASTLGQQNFLKLQPEQFQQILQRIPVTTQPQLESTVVDVGPRYDYRSLEDSPSSTITTISNDNTEDIKAAQTQVISEDRLQSAYSERREKRKKIKNNEPPGDASYAFGYETDEAARHEVADPDGNVKGWYTYIDDEGTVRKIIYTAGAGKGFVILGKEKVGGPGGGRQQSRKSQKSNKGGNSDFYADTSTLNSVKQQKPATTASSFSNYFNNWNDLAKAGTSNPPGPTSSVNTQDTVARTKKPVFIVKIRRPVNKEYHTKPLLSNPDPLPVPVTTLKTRTRRRPTGSMTLSDVVPSLRKSRIKKYPTPPIYYADDEDESGDDASSAQQASSSGSTSSSQEYDDSEQQGGGGGGSPLSVKNDGDSSYVFGYETDTANRLEKADGMGNVRGSYSYIGSNSINQLLSSRAAHRSSNHLDEQKLKRTVQRLKAKKSLKSLDPSGQKRTVHYIAGKDIGYRVIHASPSIARGVRLEAPPGYVVKRVPSLRTSESRFPIPITVPQPSAIVYHIHPDSGWKPWEPTVRKKKVKIHRKKLPKAIFESAQRNGILLLQTHPEPEVSRTEPSRSRGDTGAASTGMVHIAPAATNPYFKERITSGTGAVTQNERQYQYIPVPPPTSRRRHAPQRGYTAEPHLLHVDEEEERIIPQKYLHPSAGIPQNSPKAPASSSPSNSGSSGQPSTNHHHEREPLLYSPTFETVKEPGTSSRMPMPNPIQLQPTQVEVKNRGAPTQTTAVGPLDTSSSNHHPVAFTSDGKLQVDVPTVVIETIEAKSPSLLASATGNQNNQDVNKNAAAPLVVHYHNQLPEPAAFTQPQSGPSPLAVALANSNSITTNNNLIKGATPTTSPAYAYSAASAASYQQQLSSVTTAPAAPSASASSVILQNNGYNNNNNQHHNHHHHHHHHQKSSHVGTIAAAAPSGNINQLPGASSTAAPRSRRRHHRSKATASSTPPTSVSEISASSSSSISSSSGNLIKANAETTTIMSTSKRLINRLASAADQDATIAAA